MTAQEPTTDLTTDLATNFPDADSSPGLALWRVTNAWQRHIRAALAPHDLTHVQYVLLASLVWMNKSELITQRALADYARIDVMMTSSVVRTLERKGWLRREQHPSDGRAVVLTPTPDGISLANRATRDVETADADYFGRLEPGVRDSLMGALHVLDHGVRGHE